MKHTCVSTENGYASTSRMAVSVLSCLVIWGLSLSLPVEATAPAGKSVPVAEAAPEKNERLDEEKASTKKTEPLCRTTNKKLAAMKSRKWAACAARKEAEARQAECPEESARLAKESELCKKKSAACAEAAKW